MPAKAADSKRIVAPQTGDEDACHSCDTTANADMINASLSGTAGKAAGKIEGREPCSWFEIHYLVKELARKVGERKYDCILGIAMAALFLQSCLQRSSG